MAFTINKATAEKMYQYQSGFIPTDHATIKQYIEIVNANPEKWASAYKHVTGKDMPTTTPAAKIDPKVIKKYIAAKFGKEVSAKAMANQIEYYKENPSAYPNVIKYLDDWEKLQAATPATTKVEAPKFNVSSTLVTIWMQTVLSPGSFPSANDVMQWVIKFKTKPGGYAKILTTMGLNVPDDVLAAVAATKGETTMPDVTAAPPKKLTLSQKINAIPVKVPGPDVGYNELDPEAVEMYQTATQLIRTANKNKDYGTEYSKSLTVIRNGANKSNNGVEYLKTVIRTLDPAWKLWDPKQKVKPGGMHGLPVPTGKLSPKAQSLAASPDAEAKAAELTVKIKAYADEIARLKKLQKTADAAKAKAAKEKENLAGVDPKLLQYFTYIEQNCGDFLKSAQDAGKFLYRGQRDTKLPVFVGRPRADREPKDSSVEAQKLADKCLTIMGFKALRSNSIFTSADYHQAENYGTVYAIFPKNGFDFTWSTKHDDLVIHSTGELTGHGGDDDNVYYDWNYVLEDYTDIGTSSYESDVVSWITDSSTINYSKAEALAKIVRKTPEFVTMQKALKEWYKLDDDDKQEKVVNILISTVTAMLAFDGLKLVKGWLSANHRKKLEKFLKEAQDKLSAAVDPKAVGKDKALAEKVIKHMGFTKENLVAALKSEHEICILGEYVAVDADKYRKELRRYFLEAMTGKVKKGSSFDDDDDY